MTKWRKHPMMWVLGCIDSNGAIVAHATKEGRTHTIEESKGKRFRWCIWTQDFNITFGGIKDALTPEEYFAVCDWLIKHKYADETILSDDL